MSSRNEKIMFDKDSLLYPNVTVHQYESSISFKHSNKEDEVSSLNLDQQTLPSFILNVFFLCLFMYRIKL